MAGQKSPPRPSTRSAQSHGRNAPSSPSTTVIRNSPTAPSPNRGSFVARRTISRNVRDGGGSGSIGGSALAGATIVTASARGASSTASAAPPVVASAAPPLVTSVPSPPASAASPRVASAPAATPDVVSSPLETPAATGTGALLRASSSAKRSESTSGPASNTS